MKFLEQFEARFFFSKNGKQKRSGHSILMMMSDETNGSLMSFKFVLNVCNNSSVNGGIITKDATVYLNQQQLKPLTNVKTLALLFEVSAVLRSIYVSQIKI